MFRYWAFIKPLLWKNGPRGNFEMKKSFQTKESEFAAADHSKMSGVLSSIPLNPYVIVMRQIYKIYTCLSPNLQCWWEKNWVCKYPCCLSQGMFVEKEVTEIVLMVIPSTCKQVEMLFLHCLLVQKWKWWHMPGCSKPKVAHSGQQVWGDSPASLQTPSWPPHLVILLGKKMWQIAWNRPVHLLQPQSHGLLWRIKNFGGHLSLMAAPRWAVGGRCGGTPLLSVAEVGCSGCSAWNQHLEM